jgi:hypothetical protein
MPFTPQQMQGVARILGEKIKHGCPSCGEMNRRSLVPELYVLSSYVRPPVGLFLKDLNPYSSEAVPGGLETIGNIYQQSHQPLPPQLSAPCVMTVCTNCGFTELYNIHVLALAELLNVPAPGTSLK